MSVFSNNFYHTWVQRHGGPYDRGAADSYYRREYNPHYYVGASYKSQRIEMVDMTEKEIAEYNQGWKDNENSGARKEY